jgi:1,4-alpha-glucan branching enzyme
VGAPVGGRYVEVVNSDADEFGGSGVVNSGSLNTEPVEAHGREQSLSLTLPPLATIMLRLTRE